MLLEVHLFGFDVDQRQDANHGYENEHKLGDSVVHAQEEYFAFGFEWDFILVFVVPLLETDLRKDVAEHEDEQHAQEEQHLADVSVSATPLVLLLFETVTFALVHLELVDASLDDHTRVKADEQELQAEAQVDALQVVV